MIRENKISPDILVYAYGNPGCQDDALGYLASKWCETNITISNISVEFNYQLNVEDALLISEYDKVIFIDASVEDINDFAFSKIYPDKSIAFSTHSMSPGSVLSLCRELYSKEPEAYLLSIKGYSWMFDSNISRRAEKNLNNALIFLNSFLESSIADR